jgi:large conductance mechanosensitive channel
MKIIGEFKKFITRGNIVDMAVGVIVGSAFTAIVNALSNNILKPIINWVLALVFGADSLSEVFTFLKVARDENGLVDLTQSIYIDWGAFINAVINFFLIAIVLFTIVKFINSVREKNKELAAELDKMKLTKEDRKAMKAQGIKINRENVVKYLEEKAALKAKAEAEAKAAAEAEAAEKARLERLANPTTEDLLKEILEQIKNKA